MFNFLGDIMQGGWNAIDNVAKAAGGALEAFTSPFFPAPQKVTTLSQITQPVESTGLTYRPTLPEGQSIIETTAAYCQGWLGTPQEPILAIQPKIEESQALATKISSTPQTKTWSESFVDIFRGAGEVLGEAAKIKTVVDEFIWDLGIKKRPEEDITVTHLDTGTTTGADVVTILKGFGSAFLDQVKGLFNLGYTSPEGSQPAFAIKHELQPTKETTIGIIVILAVILAAFFLGRKK